MIFVDRKRCKIFVKENPKTPTENSTTFSNLHSFASGSLFSTIVYWRSSVMTENNRDSYIYQKLKKTLIETSSYDVSEKVYWVDMHQQQQSLLMFHCFQHVSMSLKLWANHHAQRYNILPHSFSQLSQSSSVVRKRWGNERDFKNVNVISFVSFIIFVFLFLCWSITEEISNREKRKKNHFRSNFLFREVLKRQRTFQSRNCRTKYYQLKWTSDRNYRKILLSDSFYLRKTQRKDQVSKIEKWIASREKDLHYRV